MAEWEKGCVQVYTGDGKGKTTAALGLCLRAAGHGLRSHIIQFMKGQIDYGELTAVLKFNGLITITQGGRAEFVSKSNPAAIDIELAAKALALAKKVVSEGEVDIVVLDEVNVALDYNLIPLAEVMALIQNKPAKMELVLTGRYAPEPILAAADLATEMRELKHYWKQGLSARRGIEK